MIQKAIYKIWNISSQSYYHSYRKSSWSKFPTQALRHTHGRLEDYEVHKFPIIVEAKIVLDSTGKEK